MRLLFALLLSMNAWALSNAVTIQEKSGAIQTNRVFPLHRFFADKEICQNPRPYVLQSAVTYWQATVESRWPADAACPGGYAKWAMVTAEIPSLAGGGTAVVEFRSSALSSSGGAGLDKAGVLAAAWGAKITVGVGSLTASASARAMIASNHYQILESGPLRTVYLVREGPEAVSGVTMRTTSIGFQCTATCVAPYDTATWTTAPASYQSIRPSFIVAFYVNHLGTVNAETDFLLDNGWMDRAQDQRLESLVMYNGTAETNVVYTAPAALVFPFRSRIFETFWETTPGAINIDFNRSYVTYSKVTPAYGLENNIGAGAIAAELAIFNSTFLDQGQTVTTSSTPYLGSSELKPCGNPNPCADLGGAAGGSSPILGWSARWNARYLASYDYTLLPVILANAKAQMHAPYMYIESDQTKVFHDGNTAKAFGRPVSIDARPNFMDSNAINYSVPAQMTDAPHGPTGVVMAYSTCTTGDLCMVTCAGGGLGTMQWCSAYGSGGTNWGFDMAHQQTESFVPYMVTGKRVYQEFLWAQPTLALGWWYSEDPMVVINGRWGKRGIITDMLNGDRGNAYPQKTLATAALVSPDGSVEQGYFLEKLNNNLEAREGRLNITDGDFAPSAATPPVSASCAGFNRSTETSIWRMAHCYIDPWNNPLHFPVRVTSQGSGITCAGCDASLAGSGNGPWPDTYGAIHYGWMRGLGFKSSGGSRAYNQYFMHLLADPANTGGNPAHAYRQIQPEINVGETGYLQTFAAVNAALISTALLSKDTGPTDDHIDMAERGTFYANEMDTSWRPGRYWKIDSEIVYSLANLQHKYFIWSGSVNAGHQLTTLYYADFATPVQHGFVDGQIVSFTSYGVEFGSLAFDSGVIGNANCKATTAISPKNNDCLFYVKVISPMVVELYNDAALTSLVPIVGDQYSWIYTSTLGWTEPLKIGDPSTLPNWAPIPVIRGTLGTTAATHLRGAAVTAYPIVVGPVEGADLTGSHGHYYRSALASAVDFDESIVPENTLGGAVPTISAKRAYDIAEQTTPFQSGYGNNPTCSGAGVVYPWRDCDNPQFGILPRSLIRNFSITPDATSATIRYTAPDGHACKYAVSASGFASSDDASDTSDAQSNPERSVTVRGLTPGTTYTQRVTCGPLGGAARVYGTFVATSPSSISVTGRFSGKIGQ